MDVLVTLCASTSVLCPWIIYHSPGHSLDVQVTSCVLDHIYNSPGHSLDVLVTLCASTSVLCPGSYIIAQVTH
jgi:hypothetical protein